MNFKIVSIVVIQAVMSVSHILATEKIGKYTHAVAFITPEHSHRNLKALKRPITHLQSDYPLGKVMYQGNVTNICWLDSQHLPSRGRQPWIYWGHTNNEALKVFGMKTENMEGEIWIIPFTPDNLFYALYERRHLHMTLEDMIEYHTDPEFFEILFQGCSLNIFIFPVAHHLPFGALHSGLRKFIHALAKAESAQFLLEFLGDEEEIDPSDDEIESSFNDPRKKFNVESYIERDLAFFTQTCRDIYPDDNIWAQRLQWEERDKRRVYSDGWTKLLSEPSREKLSIILRFFKKSLTDLDRLDPYYIYRHVFDMVIDLKPFSKDVVDIALDHLIASIFKKEGKSISTLENKVDRYEARVEENCSALEKCPHQFDTVKFLLEDSLNKIPINDLQDEYTNSEPKRLIFHVPTLQDLDLSDWITSAYLHGNLSAKQTIYVDVRNQNWWGTSINVLLDKYTEYFSKGQKLSPKLITYGLAHNGGQFSITDLINLKSGFEARRMHREQIIKRAHQKMTD